MTHWPRIRLRARWIVPVSSPPIENGEIVYEGPTITYVGASGGGGNADQSSELGEAAIVPGFVNAHTHLEYTAMRGLLEDLPFFDWIRELTRCKAALNQRDWEASATLGAMDAAAAGTTTLADCTDSGAAVVGAACVGLSGIAYQEAFAVTDPPTDTQVVDDVRMRLADLKVRARGTNIQIGLSPHSPYTVRPSVMRLLGELAHAEGLQLCIHAAESIAEAELLLAGSGAIADRHRERGISWIPPKPGGSAVRHLGGLGVLGPRTLLVHGVQFSAADRDVVRQTDTAWVVCPKSNAKLGNGIAPLHLLRECYRDGAERIGLGTDSVASNNGMDMLEEARFATLLQRASNRSIAAMTAAYALELATLGGARALGLHRVTGSLEPGKRADIAAVQLELPATQPVHDPVSSLIYSASGRDVRLTISSGQVIYSDGEWPLVSGKQIISQVRAAAEKLKYAVPVT